MIKQGFAHAIKYLRPTAFEQPELLLSSSWIQLCLKIGDGLGYIELFIIELKHLELLWCFRTCSRVPASKEFHHPELAAGKGNK